MENHAGLRALKAIMKGHGYTKEAIEKSRTQLAQDI
jgi:hypothetical protein